MNTQWLTLFIAILAEVTATSTLKATEGFTKIIPSAIVLLGYGTSFYFLSLTLKTMPVGIAYAVWSGVGVTLICIIGYIFYRQQLNAASIIGIFLIIVGIIIINVFSNSSAH
jgi:small multidrug resistance pump